MARFNLEDYVSVADRINEFWEKNPYGYIDTQLLNAPVADKQTQFIVRAVVGVRDGNNHYLLATGLAEESFSGTGPNQTSALENAETSAIGRALANLNFATTKSGQRQRPSRTEMEKVNRGTVSGLEVLVEKLKQKYAFPEERQEFIEGIIGRSIGGYAELTEEEVTNLTKEVE